jgi:hypothetical protein
MFHTHVTGLCSKCFINELCCIHVFYIASVLCFRGIYVHRVMGARPRRGGRGAVSRGPADGVHDAPEVL